MTGDAKMKSESAKPLIGIVVCGLSDNRQFVFSLSGIPAVSPSCFR